MPFHRWDTLRRCFKASLVHEWDVHKYDALNWSGLHEKRWPHPRVIPAGVYKIPFLILLFWPGCSFLTFQLNFTPPPTTCGMFGAGSSQEVHFSIRKSHKCVNGGGVGWGGGGAFAKQGNKSVSPHRMVSVACSSETVISSWSDDADDGDSGVRSAVLNSQRNWSNSQFMTIKSPVFDFCIISDEPFSAPDAL